MRRALFGELLGRFIHLSRHDVAEILEDQATSHRRFGEIALSMGLCQPQDIWKAWWEQISEVPERVDLESVGIDGQALCRLPRALAAEYGVIPLRMFGNQMVLAAGDGALERAARDLPRATGMQLKFVLADARDIREAIAHCYPQRDGTAQARHAVSAVAV